MFAIYRKHARLMVLLMIFSCLLGLVYYVHARPFYYAKARVRIVPVAGSPAVDTSARESQLRALLTELNAAPMIERTARRLGVKASARELQLRSVLKQSIRISLGDRLEIECWSASAELARRWPAALIEEFQSYRREMHARDLQEIVRSYREELQEVASKLGRKIEINDPDDVLRVLAELQQFETSPTELVRVSQRLDRLGQVRIELENTALDTAAKLALLSALDERSENGGRPAGPLKRVPSGNQIAADELSEEYQRARSRFESEYQALIKKKGDLEKLPSPANLREAAGAALESGSRVSHRPLSDVAVELQNKIKRLEDEWKGAVELAFERTVETRDQPVSPQPGKLLLLSLLAGAALALGLPFLLAFFDRSLARPKQVESVLRLRALGSVRKLSLPAGARGSTQEEVESFRSIAASLQALGSANSSAHVVMVSSALRGEGKTIAVSNLGICFADLGARTVVIDCDLGRSRIHRHFGYRQSPGLAEVLRGELSFEKACRVPSHRDLSILPAGKPVESGTELLGSAAFITLMKLLRTKFDCVLLDTPPVLGFSEASIVQKHVDGVVLVIRSGATPRANVQAAIEMLQVNGAHFYGAVLNGVDEVAMRSEPEPKRHDQLAIAREQGEL